MFNDDRQKAYALYVLSGQPYSLDDVAKITGVSLSTLKRWSTQGKWKQEKIKHIQVLRQKSKLEQDIKLKALEMAAGAQDPNDIYKLMNSLIGSEKIELIRKRLIGELSAGSFKPDENFYRALADRVMSGLMEKFRNDDEKYNALRLIEAELIDAITNYEL